MADSQAISSSSYSTKFTSKSVNGGTKIDKLSQETNHLVILGAQLSWNGEFDRLKLFTSDVLKLRGELKSPGGEAKRFTSSNGELIFKWQGLVSTNIKIEKDDNNELLEIMKEHAEGEEESVAINDDQRLDDHVLNEAMCLPLPSPKCHHCGKDDLDEAESQCKLEQFVARLNKLEEKVNCDKMAESTYLIENNKNMGNEVDILKAMVAELQHENNRMKTLLDIKQSEWIEIESKQRSSSSPSSKKSKATSMPSSSSTPLLRNRYASLPVENHVPDSPVETTTNSCIRSQIHEYQAKQKQKFKNTRTKSVNTIDLSKQPKETNSTLVIGDSMVKHLQGSKMVKAAGGKTICHSYSGTTVEQIEQKFEDTDEAFETVIVHVGTNDLVREDPSKVGKKMEQLMEKVKPRAKKVAVSSVIARYDGRVEPSKIACYNKLLSNLCQKHKVDYIDNDRIGQSLLNRSNLHLNRDGDRVLGSTFCNFLKSTRANKVKPATSGNEHHFFHRAGHRSPQWTMYLRYVSQVMKN